MSIQYLAVPFSETPNSTRFRSKASFWLRHLPMVVLGCTIGVAQDTAPKCPALLSLPGRLATAAPQLLTSPVNFQAAVTAANAGPTVLTLSEPDNFAVLRYRLKSYADWQGCFFEQKKIGICPL